VEYNFTWSIADFENINEIEEILENSGDDEEESSGALVCTWLEYPESYYVNILNF